MSKFKVNDWVLDDEDNLFQVTRVRGDEIALGDEPYYVPAKEFRLKGQDDEDNRLNSNIDTTVDSDNIISKMTIPIIEVDEEMDREIDKYLSKQDSYRESELALDTFTAHGFEVPSWDGFELATKAERDSLYVSEEE